MASQLVLTPIATDTFGTPANWTAVTGGGMTLAPGSATGVSSAVAGDFYNGTFNSNQYSQITLGTLTTGSSGYVGATTRGSAASWYGAYYAGGAGLLLFKRVAGTDTQIGTTLAVTMNTGDTLALVSEGSQHTAYHNGVPIASFLDTSITTGTPGITSFNGNSITSFTGGNAATAATGAAIGTDNFNRANGPASSGQPNWTSLAGVTFSGVSVADGDIVSNELNESDTQHHAAHRNETYSNDQWAEIQMGSVPVTNGFVGAMVRWNGSTGYLGVCCTGSPGPGYVLYKIANGASSSPILSVYSPQPTIPNPTGTAFRVLAQGSRISMRVNGAEVAAVTDTTSTAGQPGYINFPTSTADNFSSGNIVISMAGSNINGMPIDGTTHGLIVVDGATAVSPVILQGFLRDTSTTPPSIITTTAGPGVVHNGFMRDANYRLICIDESTATGVKQIDGFNRDSQGFLVTTTNAATRMQNGLNRDAAGNVVVSGTI